VKVRAAWMLLGLISTVSAQEVQAQVQPWDLRGGMAVGSEEEGYLRVLQVAGMTPSYPWGLRGFTPGELGRLTITDTLHPWVDRFDFSPDSSETREWGWLPARGGILLNSAFPFGENDGVVWAGKGFTGKMGVGGYARYGRLHVRIAPEAFITQNRTFELAPNGLAGDGAQRDSRFPTRIDNPQRFGDGSYARLDGGASAVHLEVSGLTLGLSSAGQVWGPAVHYPLLLGNNAGGFPHLFIQSSKPTNIGIGQVHGRLIAGSLRQSPFSPVSAGERRRFISGFVLLFLPRGLQGLEMGLGRIAESVWPEGGIRLGDIFRPFTNVVSVPGDGSNLLDENQIAGVFFRWTIPAGGIEIYAEVTRNDSAGDIRTYLIRPDDLMARVFGLQKVWRGTRGNLIALRAEVVNAETHHSERGNRLRDAGPRPPSWPPYFHAQVQQGHTQHGQILGSPTAYGGAGWTVGVDLYHPGGRWTIDLSRSLRQDWLAGSQVSDPAVADVVYSLSLEAVRFHEGMEITAEFTPSLNLNRNLVPGNDVMNLRLGLAVRRLVH